MNPIVQAAGLTKHYRNRVAVRGINVSIPAGVCFGFLGPNGAGKTTTLRMILGLTPAIAGTLKVFDQDVARHGRTVRARVGVVPQEDNLDPDFTVYENLAIYAGYFSIPRDQIAHRAQTLLAFAGLEDRADVRISTLSGGMRRRLTIARALINDPELVILDEPTTGLDPQVRHMIWSRLRQLKQQGKTLLLTTHYMEEAERLCDEVVIMDQGAIVQQGTPAELIRRHVEPEVLELRGAADRARKKLDGVAGCRTEPVGDTVYCYSREVKPVLAQLEQMPEITYLHRPANLEDVFLRLTGRDLRE
jgi:lipooligosaccharide transport system ATP-binding protein